MAQVTKKVRVVRRIMWDRWQDLVAVRMAECGMYASTIARKCGLNTNQVYYRSRKAGIKLSDYRRGVGKAGKNLFAKLETDKKAYGHLSQRNKGFVALKMKNRCVAATARREGVRVGKF